MEEMTFTFFWKTANAGICHYGNGRLALLMEKGKRNKARDNQGAERLYYGPRASFLRQSRLHGNSIWCVSGMLINL